MRKFWIFAGLVLLTFSSFGQQLNALLSYNTYCTDKLEPYVEFTFLIDGQSLKYVPNENGKFQAGVKINIDISQKDSVVKRLDFLLLSDEFDDSIRASKPDFADIQNVLLPNGEYFVRFMVKDSNNTSNPFVYIDQIKANFVEDKVSMADIVLLNKLMPQEEANLFNKYGYCMVPLFHDYVPEAMVALPFFTEIYNTDKVLGYKEKFVVRTYIEEAINHRVVNPQLITTKSYTTAPVNILVHQFNVFNLPSGNYNIVVEIMNSDSTTLLAARTFFQRSNPHVKLNIDAFSDVNIENTFVSKITDLKTMQNYIGSLHPIANALEQEFFVTRMKTIPLDKLQRFFYSFWLSRNPVDPETEWKHYQAKIDYVQEKYGSKQVKGFRTDRGRVYLQYGPPNNITEAPYDPTMYPYEIWHYYNMGEQNDIKFVFYDPDLVSNDYVLIHSNAIGEPKDSQWKIKMKMGRNPIYNFDTTTPDSYWGGNVNEDWLYGR